MKQKSNNKLVAFLASLLMLQQAMIIVLVGYTCKVTGKKCDTQFDDSMETELDQEILKARKNYFMKHND